MGSSFNFSMTSLDEQYQSLLPALKELTLKLRESGIEITPLEGDRANLCSDLTFKGFEYPLPGIKMAIFEATEVTIKQNGQTVTYAIPDDLQIIKTVVLREEERLY
jgi:hypothetical protein